MPVVDAVTTPLDTNLVKEAAAELRRLKERVVQEAATRVEVDSQLTQAVDTIISTGSINVLSEAPTAVSVGALLAVNTAITTAVNVLNYHSMLSDGGGGVFYWDATKAKSEHNGGTVIDPTVVFPTDWTNQTQLTTWFDASNTGAGCWVRQYEGAVNVKWFGAKGDGTTNDTLTLNHCLGLGVVTKPVVIYIPKGRYLTTETLRVTGMVTKIFGDGSSGGAGTQFYVGGSSLFANHTNEGVLSLKGKGFIDVSNLALEADQNNAPKAGLILGRDSSASAGSHLIQRVQIRGNYSVSCIYSIASEENNFIGVYAWLYAESTGFATYYCAEADNYSVDTLTTSTNISGHFFGCSFINSQFDDLDPLEEPAVIFIEASSQTGGYSFNSCYLVANAGSYVRINESASAGNVLGPFTFNSVNGERLGTSGNPMYGFRLEAGSSSVVLRGLTVLSSRFTFQAGADKKAVYIDPVISLYNPNIVINPEEGFPYALIDVPYASINGGIFSVGREWLWTAVPLSTGWINRFGSPYVQAGYKIKSDGQVVFRGEIAGSGTVMTLPANARPKVPQRIYVRGDSASMLFTVNTDGTVTSSGTATSVDLTSLTFYRN